MAEYDNGASVEPRSKFSVPTSLRAKIAKAWIAAQRARERHFDVILAGDPVWDILLALYIGLADARQECVKNICLASSAPPTTVSRWIIILEKRGLVVRQPDPRDKRRVLLALTEDGIQRMEQALDACAESDARLGIGRLRAIEP